MALKTFTGELVVLNGKTVQGRNGPIKAYSGKVQKSDGVEYDEWIGFGFKKPEANQGDQVVITAKKEKGFWKAVDVEVTEAGEAQESGPSGLEDSEDSSDQQESSSSSKPKATAAPKKFWQPKDPQQQKNIHYQNSRTAALQMADLLIKSKAVPLSATVGKGGEQKRFEEVTALVNKLTVIYFHDLESFRLVKDIEDVYEAPEAAEAGFDGEESDPEPTDDE